MSKKLFSLLLVLALVFTMSATALAANEYSNLLPTVKTIPNDYANKIIILHSNDVHGALDGYAYMAALKNQFMAAGASDVILVDAGDFSQGTPYVSLSKGESAIEMMNAAGYDVVTLGNHDFDYGYAQLMENLSKAQFTTLCCDVYLAETGEPILPASVVMEPQGGVKIGFIGIETPETATKVNPGLITEIDFATFDKLYEATQAAVDEIRDDCDLVIALSHLGMEPEGALNGYRSADMLDHVTGIDFTIDGHAHYVMTSALDGKAIQSTGTRFAYIGVVVIDPETKTVEDNFLLDTSKLAKDEEVAAKAEELMSSVDEIYGAPFATSEVVLDGEKANVRTHETNLGDLVTDAMVWSVVKEGGIEQVEPNQVVGITNGGGIRVTLQPGDISMSDVNTVMPFGNTVAVIYVTGEELLEALEASTFCTPETVGGYPQTSGIEWTLDTTKEYDQGEVYTLNGKESSYFAPASIQRVTINAINGEPFDPEATYAVVTNNFLAAGGDTYNVFNRAYVEGAGFDTGIPLDEAVMEYVTTELEGVISADMYGEPRGSLTQIEAEETEEAEEEAPAA